MGMQLTENFRQPYLARSVGEFWRRWHITLSSWLRDYIFTPLAFRWRSWKILGMVMAAMVTFAIAGIWHGANWTFVLFGLLHGLAISAELLTEDVRKKMAPKINGFLWKMAGNVYTFGFWCFSLIFFRAKSMADAFYIVSHLFTGLGAYLRQIFHYTGKVGSGLLTPFLAGQHREDFLIVTTAVLLFILIDFLEMKNNGINLMDRPPTWLRWSAYYALFFGILFFGVFNKTPFIYFQF